MIFLVFLLILFCWAFRRRRAYAFVINMPGERGAVRRDWLRRVSARTGIKLQHVDAVDKDTVDHKMHDVGRDLRKTDGHRDLTSGEIALSLSHQKVYQYILDHDIPVALIAEDDFDPCENFAERLKQVAALLRNVDFDLVKLETCNQGLPSSDELVQVKKGEGGACSACYIVSQSGARILRDANTPVWMNSDGIMDPYHLRTVGRTLKQYYVSPPIVRQNLDVARFGSHRE